MSSDEFLNLYADLRLGLSLEESQALTYNMLDTLLFEAMPATVTLNGWAKKDDSLPEEYQRDLARAALVKGVVTEA